MTKIHLENGLETYLIEDKFVALLILYQYARELFQFLIILLIIQENIHMMLGEISRNSYQKV